MSVYYSAAELLRGENVIHFIDNSSAVAALVKGYSQKPDSAHILHALWALVCGLSCAPWFEFVRTKANVADLPSRGELEYITNVLKATELQFKMPPFEMWTSIEAALQAIDSHTASMTAVPSASSKKRVRSRR